MVYLSSIAEQNRLSLNKKRFKVFESSKETFSKKFPWWGSRGNAPWLRNHFYTLVGEGPPHGIPLIDSRTEPFVS